MQPAIRVTALTKTFGSRRALDGVTLEVMAGHLHGISSWRSLLRWFRRDELARGIEALTRVGIAEQAAQQTHQTMFAELSYRSSMLRVAGMEALQSARSSNLPCRSQIRCRSNSRG